MIRILTVFAVLIVIAIGAMFLFQGGGQPPLPTDQPGPGTTAGDNGEVIEPPGPQFVYISGAEADTLDPTDASWLTDFRMIECIFETLLRIETKGMTLEGGAAEKWEVSPDKLTYTFHIRPDARWSNGDPVTAQDYIFGWMRVLNPDAAAPYYNLMLPIKGAKAWYDGRQAATDAYRKGDDKSAAAAQALWQASVKKFHETVGVAAKDDKTLVITLEQPVAYFLELIAFPTFSPVHQKSIEPLLTVDAASGLVELSAKTHFMSPGVICNGPYVLTERKLQQQTRLSPNVHYWNARRVANKGILCRIIEDKGAMLLEYQSGGVHWLPDLPTTSPEAAQLVQQKNAGLRKDVHVEPAAGTYFYHFNCKPQVGGKANVLADPLVRRALSMAIDRETIVTKVTRLNQPVALTVTPIGSVPGYAPPVHVGIAFDPSGARKLLAEAGFPGGKGFPDDMKFAYNTSAGHELIAQFVTRTWETELGIKVGLDGVEKNRMMEMWRKHDYTLSRGSWYGDYRDATTWLDLFITGGGNNHAAYSNPKVDQMLAQAAKEPDEAKRNEILRNVEAIILTEAPIAPIYQYINLHIFDPQKVTGLNPNPWNNRRLEQVRVRP